MDAKKIECTCFSCGLPLIFTSKRRQKKSCCSKCRNIVCQECTSQSSLRNGKMIIKCNTCTNSEVKPEDTPTAQAINTIQQTPHILTSAKDDIDSHEVVKVFQEIVNCPICLDLMSKPIVLCTAGHSMCESCVYGKVTHCPLCRSWISKTRNYALEKFLRDLNLKPRTDFEKTCRYLERGCAKYFDKDQDKTSHEMECTLRDIKCPLEDYFQDCRYEGTIEELVDHFERYHGKTMLRNNTEATAIINIEEDVDEFSIIDFGYSKYFLLRHKTKVKSQKAYWAIQFMGSKDMAREYNYKFEISNGRKKYKITEICENYITGCNGIFENENCFFISFRNLVTYLDDRGQIKIKFHIYKVNSS